MTIKTSHFRLSLRRTLCALCLTIAFVPDPTHAQLAVIDVPGLTASTVQWAKEAVQWGKQAQIWSTEAMRWIETKKFYLDMAINWQATASHYAQQLVGFGPIEFKDIEAKSEFKPRDIDFSLEERCPGANKGLLSGLLNRDFPKLTGNLREEQRELCATIVHAENQQYNITVELLDQLVESHNTFRAKIDAQRAKVGTSEGKLAANTNEAQRFAARLQAQITHAEQQIKAYDTVIASLKTHQSVLSRRAFKGDVEKLGGKLVQAATLAAALRL
ncbi:hypothetical protein FHW69_002985 [Luteibacter sp. Sphag1AF]|uniref:hypothetical protein n=1 Tax=Luteibacter sp. Sphag1AF TaxID=2587031 RepID=UPI00161D08AA|nr:hypothetical protein [Luteibacter sp. Sphag1AF]MBB3228350.1 hypothetical protein [Luteibacter sp. Sphag1AF]